jgi:hypothetical protein
MATSSPIVRRRGYPDLAVSFKAATGALWESSRPVDNG